MKYQVAAGLDVPPPPFIYFLSGYTVYWKSDKINPWKRRFILFPLPEYFYCQHSIRVVTLFKTNLKTEMKYRKNMPANS